MNKSTLIGNLGAAPEVRYTQDGTPVATFSIATTERWKDSNGDKQEHTEWHRIVAWRRLAEICGEFLKTGSKVYVEGKLQTRKWKDQSGNDRYTTEIVLREMEMLGGGQQQDVPSAPQGEEPPLPSGEDVPF